MASKVYSWCSLTIPIRVTTSSLVESSLTFNLDVEERPVVTAESWAAITGNLVMTSEREIGKNPPSLDTR